MLKTNRSKTLNCFLRVARHLMKTVVFIKIITLVFFRFSQSISFHIKRGSGRKEIYIAKSPKHKSILCLSVSHHRLSNSHLTFVFCPTKMLICFKSVRQSKVGHIFSLVHQINTPLSLLFIPGYCYRC